MPSFYFGVFCSCGKGLCGQATVEQGRDGDKKITIDPCPDCLREAEREGYNNGEEEGYESGLIEGEKSNDQA